MMMANSVLVSEVFKVKSMPLRFTKLLWENPYGEHFFCLWFKQVYMYRNVS